MGLTFTGGLSTMLPILKVLMSGESVQNWAARLVVEHRLEISLADASDKVLIVRAHHLGAGSSAGLKDGDLLSAGGEGSDTRRAEKTLEAIADPAASSITLTVDRPAQPRQENRAALALPPLKWYFAGFYRICSIVPANPVWAIAAVMGVMFALGLIGNFVRFYQEYFSDKAAILEQYVTGFVMSSFTNTYVLLGIVVGAG